MSKDHSDSAMICMVFCTIVWVIFCFLDFYRLDFFNRYTNLPLDLWILVITRWTSLIVFIFGIIHLTSPRKNLENTMSVTYIAIAIGLSVTTMIYKSRNLPHAELSLAIVISAAFMPFGLRFLRSLFLAAFASILPIALGYIIMPKATYEQHLFLSLMLLMAGVVGAIGGYSREKAHREQFLMRSILQRYAFSDSLTQLANRRMFMKHAATALAHAERSGDHIVYAIVDVDYFKQFNDLYGHAAGDDALKKVARQLESSLHRPMDMAARIGGEEFALMFFGTNAADAEKLIVELQDRVKSLEIVHGSSTVSPILTVSIGATEIRRDDTIEAAMLRADDLLYVSKRAGRNLATFG